MHMSTCGSELLTSALGVTKKHFFVPAMNMSTCGSELLGRDMDSHRKTQEPINMPRQPMSRKCFTCLHRTGERGSDGGAGERGDGEEEDGEKGQDPYMSGA
jgi:hypothetical protein